MKEPRRALLITEKTSRPSYEPRHGETPTGRHFVRKPDRNTAGRRFESDTSRGLATLREGPAVAAVTRSGASTLGEHAVGAHRSTDQALCEPLSFVAAGE